MMSANRLRDTLEREMDDFPDGIDAERLESILTEPAQERLADAIAADIIDAAPIAGDLLALIRMENAKKQGVEYPERPAFVENVISDLPPPIDTIGDIIVSQNVLHHLEDERGIPVAALPDDLTVEAATDVDSFIEGALGVNDD